MITEEQREEHYRMDSDYQPTDFMDKYTPFRTRPEEKNEIREYAGRVGEATVYFWLQSYFFRYSYHTRQRHLAPVIDQLVYSLMEEKTR